jgi:hypothetical protein
MENRFSDTLLEGLFNHFIKNVPVMQMEELYASLILNILSKLAALTDRRT